MTTRFLITPATALAAALLGQPATAQDVGQHPAVFAARKLPGVDANTFIVGHPASPRNRVQHANGEHPAVLVAAHAAQHAAGPDSNRFLVQPPAAVRWTTGLAADAPQVASRANTVAALAR